MLRRLIVAAAVAPAAAAAAVVTVQWNGAGVFAHAATLAPGQFLEICDALPLRAEVAWRFSSTAAVDFNIHYHAGSEVHMPDKRDRVARAEGVLRTASPHDHCWMWTNSGPNATDVEVQLHRR